MSCSCYSLRLEAGCHDAVDRLRAVVWQIDERTCLRWDYTAPYPKSFLICGGVLHAWNEEDKTGRRYRVDRKKEPGLDLRLLGVDELRERYLAGAKTVEGRQVCERDLGFSVHVLGRRSLGQPVSYRRLARGEGCPKGQNCYPIG